MSFWIETEFINENVCFINPICLCLFDFFRGWRQVSIIQNLWNMRESGNESLIHQSSTSIS